MPSLRADGGGVRGVVDIGRFVCLGPVKLSPLLLCSRLRRPSPPPPLLLLNGSHSDVCEGVERIPFELTVSTSALNLLIDEGDGDEARNKR